jgi:hypothetical protein
MEAAGTLGPSRPATISSSPLGFKPKTPTFPSRIFPLPIGKNKESPSPHFFGYGNEYPAAFYPPMSSPFHQLPPSCVSFLQALEGMLQPSPRNWLRWFDLHASPRWISEQEFSEILAFWRNRLAGVCVSSSRPARSRS